MDRCRTSLSCRRPLLWLAAAAVFCGCLSGDPCRAQSLVPAPAAPQLAAPETVPNYFAPPSLPAPGATLDRAGIVKQSEELLAQAKRLDLFGRSQCVEFYYRAAMQATLALDVHCPGDPQQQAAWQAYQRALTGLLPAAERYGRLNPQRQLVVDDQGKCVVPIRYYGFAWKPGDFCQVYNAERIPDRKLSHHYATCGLGLTLVAVRVAACQNELFFRPRQPFAVTAVLRPQSQAVVHEESAAETGPPTESVLEFYNPHVYQTVPWGGASLPLAGDLTAPMAAVVDQAPKQYLRGFTAPSDTSFKPQLILVEPYQRGKIPVIFIHGLYSDGTTWVDTVNELRAQSDLYQQFQFWVFRYPTGGEVLDAAAELRSKLQLVRLNYVPQNDDPAFDQTVLIGHSLGGLVAKLQVTTSYDILWQSIANRPFTELRAPPDLQARLGRDFFFTPAPSVTRVVFVATPHQGSNYANRLVGRIGSLLVNFGEQEKMQYRQLMEANRDVFKPVVADRRPTTVDMLEPTSPLLLALLQLPFSPRVRINSIIGTGDGNPLAEPGDGVVSIVSARLSGVESEAFVPAKHEQVHRHPQSIAELSRILRLHASQQNLRATDAEQLPPP